MAKLSWKQAFINSVDAYRTAKGTTDKIAVGTFPTLLEEAIGSNGGNVVNGLVESYLAATETINANTFVEFVGGSEGIGVLSNNTALTLTNNIFAYYAIELSKNKVFLAYGYSNATYGTIVTINGIEITVGTPVLLSSTYMPNVDSNNGMRLVKLSENKVFMALSPYGTYDKIYGSVININEDVISTGALTTIVTTANYYNSEWCLVALTENSVLILHTGTSGSVYKLYGNVLTINESSFTVGGLYIINDANGSGYSLIDRAIRMSDNRVLIINGSYDSAYSSSALYATLVAVNGNSISKLSIATLSTESGSYGYAGIAQLNETRAFVVYCISNNVYGVIIDTSSDAVSITLSNTLFTTTNMIYSFKVVKLSDTEVYVGYADDTNVTLYGAHVHIDSAITVSTNINIVASKLRHSSNKARFSICSTSLYKMLVIYGLDSDYKTLYGDMVGLDDLKIKPAITKINGITKTEVTTETPGEVWVLNPDA